MHVYVLHETRKSKHAEDMKTILGYLRARGVLHIKPSAVEKYYSKFSEEKYSASWLHVDILALEDFAEWLSEQEI